MSTFQALRVVDAGDRKTRCEQQSLGLEDLGEGEVVIDVHWSSVNYKDALAVTGKGRIIRRTPCVPGIDLSGIVAESSDPAFQPGQKVLVTGCNIGELLNGGFAQRARLPAEVVIPLPDGLDLREAMMLGTAGFTAGLAVLRMRENRQTPELGPVLVNGATGGVGSIAIQILSALGYEVAAVTRKGEAAERLRGLGATQVLSPEEAATDGKPLEKARWGGGVDNLGGDALAEMTRSVVPFGNIASIGLAGGVELHTTVMPFILRGVSILGIHSVETPRPLREQVWAQLAGDWKPKGLAETVTRTLTLAEVPGYCEDLIAGTVTGRALVQLREDAQR
ncbi:YhdH/YhfP family quinone oxidoreductase [Algiphilus aromaticivorans]|uniref:YhdH/YhfP family quinone oxidoreductase n=1 Tax=Algiphilus aromaticivorans TaxID=382454 RepID=UPI0005C1BC80|nr:YhdH/YhfP family quinone oxidoreductase [Algiphilus aromaticivorans]